MRGNFASVASESFSERTLSNESTHSKIIIIDDIYTTGSTLDECARVLRNTATFKAQPEVYGLLWARS
ncbi:hypothetical protein KCTCHS21_55540 [Cohnella abietis]|uniref:Uncharacterized protein n=2 Tax=Cohnella abietis TaxID=2507935 RepID=A0A3T1DE34_9BACL|nr:hypothetical protein KCTCHS21_55540 [Cohnella abietis]